MTTAQDQQSRAVIAAWNAQADEHNQWETLGDDEKIDWAMKAARALPASMKPVAEIFAGDLFRVNQGPDAEPVTGDHDLYTAAQVQTMLAHRGHGEGANQPQTRMDAGSHRGRGLPSGWQLAPLEPTEEQLAAVRQEPHPANPNGWDANHRRIYREMLAAVPQPPAAQEHAYICPVRTVADLVNNLLLMDQTLPIYGAQYIEHPVGKRRVITVPPTVSRERVKDRRWIGEGEELNAAVIWTRAEQPTVQKLEPLTNEQIEEFHGEANRGFDIGHDEYFKAFRDGERAHGITDTP